MTVDIVKNENEILKQSQSHLLQFKEAARRYRDLANSKAAECVALAEEVISLRKERGISTSSSAQITLMNSDSSFSYTKGDRTPPGNRTENMWSSKGRFTTETLMMKSARNSLLSKNYENIVTESSEADVREMNQLPRPQEACVKPQNEY